MSGVSVERATSHDRAAMEALLAANQLPTAGLKESMDTALVARVGSRTIGCAALEVYPSGVLLRSVAVDAAWRGRGIYRALVAHRASLAVKRRRRYLEVDASDDSRPILERLGYTLARAKTNIGLGKVTNTTADETKKEEPVAATR